MTAIVLLLILSFRHYLPFWPVLFSPYRRLLPYIVAQARHETNNFTSNALKVSNNLVGMKDATVRTQLGYFDPLTKYRDYKSRTESIRDLLEWMKFTLFPTSAKNVYEYAANLKYRGYYADTISNYEKGLERWS